MIARFAMRVRVVILAACLIVVMPLMTRGEDAPEGAILFPAFYLEAFDKKSRLLHTGQGIVVGPLGNAIVSVTTLEGAASAIATMADGSKFSVRQVRAVDEVCGLAKIRLQLSTPRPVRRFSGSAIPQVGKQIIFSDVTRHGERTRSACSVTSVRAIPGFEDLYHVVTTQPLPPPAGSIHDLTGNLVGLVVLVFGEGRSGIVATGGRLSNLARNMGRRVTLDDWTRKSSIRWQQSDYVRYMTAQTALWKGRPDITLDLLQGYSGSHLYLKMNIAALLGEAFLEVGILPEAILAFKEAIELGSPPGRVYRELAQAYLETGQYVSAETMCHEAIRRDPECLSGYTLLAHLENLQGRHGQAVYEAGRALKRDQDCVSAYLERGRGYIGLGRYQDAINSLETAVDLDRDCSAVLSSLGYAYLRNGNPALAIQILTDALRLSPEIVKAWDSLGEAYSRSNLPNQALVALRKVVELSPGESYAYCRLARELFKTGKYLEAADLLRQGLDLCVESQWLNFYLGIALHRSGKVELARKQAELLSLENKALADQLSRRIASES